MKRYVIQLETKQPLLLKRRANPTANALNGVDVIPGSSLRGALAWAWIEDGNDPDRDPWFQNAFVREGVCFGPLYPIADNWRSPSPMLAGPLPETATGCKRFAGFGKEGHGVFDDLFRDEIALFDGASPSAAFKRYRAFFDHCRHFFEETSGISCECAMRRKSGLAIMDRDQPSMVNVARETMLKSAVDTRIESVSEGCLFTSEAVAAGTEYLGEITVHDGADIEPLINYTTLRLGACATRGYGKVEVDWLGNDGGLAPIADRFDAFQKRAQKLRLPDQSGWWVSLDLRSPTILSDPWLNDALAITPECLTAYGSDLEWRLIAQYTRPTTVSGWNAKLKMPKTSRTALDAGGVALFLVKGPLDNVLATLARLETHGLGERVGEGFGRVVACHPFHIDRFPDFEEEKP